MRRLGVLALVAALVAAVAVSSAHAALFFLFKPTSANAGDLVTVRLGGTPTSFTAEDAKPPSRDAIRLYLVPRDVAGEVESRFDRRLHFVGRIVSDRNARGILSFTVPPVDTGRYALAYWCPGCARYSRGVSFGVQTVPRVSRYRRWMGLDVNLPAATGTCPVTIPNVRKPRAAPGDPSWHGNGLLFAVIRMDGVWPAKMHKILWWAAVDSGDLKVELTRLDAPAEPSRVREVIRGSFAWQRSGLSWAARTSLSVGCWRITGRVGDIALSYVVNVVAGP